MHKENMRIMFPAPRLAAIEDDEAEIRAMFGITEDSDGQDTNVSTTESSATDENKSSETPDTNTSEGNTEKEEPEKTETETKPIKSERSTELNPEDKFMSPIIAFAIRLNDLFIILYSGSDAVSSYL